MFTRRIASTAKTLTLPSPGVPGEGSQKSAAWGQNETTFTMLNFRINSSISTPRTFENQLPFPHISNPHFSSTRIDPTLSLATREQWPDVDVFQKLDQRTCCDAPAPEFLADPVTDFALAGLFEAHDMTGDSFVEQDGLLEDRRIVDDPHPVLVEGVSVRGVFAGEGCHVIGIGVELLLEKNGQIRIDQIAKLNAE